jgi:general secretion pathway protein A
VFESHFGFSAPPFQLNPDPTFYFGSKGHSNALAYLQYGVHQAEGFIVVTGEIGAGKTTLVRTLLEGLDVGQVRAAQIASTQLDAMGLLQAILTAFGVPPPAGPPSKPSLISTLEAFFMTLAVKNKRALLVVDEAQNLSLDAIEELRMLSNFQLRKQALLQSFLVGQPELRAMLESQRLEQLRQRVIASCHLGPLDQEETRQYIEHRLNRVGWRDSPSFDAASAFKKIHEATGGIPRRINLLCNRLLLSAFLENINHINEDHVVRIARELRDEVGETTVAILPSKRSVEPMVQPPSHRPSEPFVEFKPSALPAPRVAREAVFEAPYELHRIVRNDALVDRKIVFCLVDSQVSYLKAALLCAAFERSACPYQVVVVACKTAQYLGATENYAEAVDLPSMEVHLGVTTGTMARRIADGVLRFEALLDEFTPAAVVCLGLSDEAVACAVLAVRQSVALVRPDAGWLPASTFSAWRLSVKLLDQAAAVLYTDSESAAAALVQQGVAPERTQVVGSLMFDLMAATRSSDALSQALLMHHRLVDGFVMVTSRIGAGRLSPKSLGEVLAMLARVKGERQMLWLVCGETQSALRSQGLGTALSRSGIALASTPLLSARLGLLQKASYLVTDEPDELVEVALALGKKVCLIDETNHHQVNEHEGVVVWLPLNAVTLGASLPERQLGSTHAEVSCALVAHLTSWLESSD